MKIKKLRENIRIFGPVLLIVMLLLVGLKLWAGRNASAAWFDTNWAFRQKIALSNTTGTTQTSFQVQVTIDTATLITAGKMQSSCQDVRFTSIAGKNLPYWIEPTTCNTATTKVWVNVDSIPTATSGTSADIYFYYGNPAATTKSVTTSTFIKDLTGVAATWPLSDTTATQSYSTVLNPAVATGRNIAINGTLDSSSNWLLGAGWTISGGVASSDGTQGATTYLQQNPAPVTIGKA